MVTNTGCIFLGYMWMYIIALNSLDFPTSTSKFHTTSVGIPMGIGHAAEAVENFLFLFLFCLSAPFSLFITVVLLNIGLYYIHDTKVTCTFKFSLIINNVNAITNFLLVINVTK